MGFSRGTTSALTCALALVLGSAAMAQDDLATVLAGLGAAECADSSLTCVTLAMPRDHRGNDPDATIDITFAVSLASIESLGVLIYAVGGPGSSGLAAAKGYLGAFDESLTANLDIVFFDQRGIGPDHGIACPLAQGVFDMADLPLDDPAGTIAAARTYTMDCIAESGAQDLLPFVNTDQAIRDIEGFRQAIGAPRVFVYGESYGTQFAQQYATAFPTAIRAVIIDGVVDLTRSFSGFYDSYTSGAERILARVLAGCSAIPVCAADVQGDATAAYDALAATLAQGPVSVTFPLGNGTTEPRGMNTAILQTNAFNALYGPDDRSYFLRALAAASHGDMVPMLQLYYASMEVDPDSGAGVAHASWFGAAYYAITCADYAEGTAAPETNAQAVIADAIDFAPQAPRLLRNHYAERLVCAFWPVRGAVTRPAPFAGGDYPTLVLTSDSDPITPAEMAYTVVDNVRNGSLIVMQGGPHVIWGRGFGCPNQIVDALLFQDAAPAQETQICQQDFLGSYSALTLTDPADAADPLTLVRAVETELKQSTPLQYWDWTDPLSIGCNHGGTLGVSDGETGADLVFSDCAFWPSLVLNGSGEWIADGADDDRLSLALTVSGSHAGTIESHSSSHTGAISLGGIYQGVDLASYRPAP